MSNDAAAVAPNVYKVLFENERVRLLEVHMKPGDSSATHSHPDYLAYVLSDGTVSLTSAAGDTAEVPLKTGDIMWREAEEHSAHNPGSSDVAALFFELK